MHSGIALTLFMHRFVKEIASVCVTDKPEWRTLLCFTDHSLYSNRIHAGVNKQTTSNLIQSTFSEHNPNIVQNNKPYLSQYALQHTNKDCRGALCQRLRDVSAMNGCPSCNWMCPQTLIQRAQRKFNKRNPGKKKKKEKSCHVTNTHFSGPRLTVTTHNHKANTNLTTHSMINENQLAWVLSDHTV